MVLMHMVVILSSVWGANGSQLPQAPTEGQTITMHYGKPGQSRIGTHRGYGYRLNHDDPVKTMEGIEPVRKVLR